jgi:hypothetical protein
MSCPFSELESPAPREEYVRVWPAVMQKAVCRWLNAGEQHDLPAKGAGYVCGGGGGGAGEMSWDVGGVLACVRALCCVGRQEVGCAGLHTHSVPCFGGRGERGLCSAGTM